MSSNELESENTELRVKLCAVRAALEETATAAALLMQVIAGQVDIESFPAYLDGFGVRAKKALSDTALDCPHQARLRTEQVKVEKLEAELHETWTDERGTCWTRPTAYAYAKACAALHSHQEKERQAHATLDKIRTVLFAHGENNEATAHPWWGVVKRNRMGEHSILAGPFFSRDAAATHLDARRYEYGNGIVFCFSGHRSCHYVQLRELVDSVLVSSTSEKPSDGKESGCE